MTLPRNIRIWRLTMLLFTLISFAPIATAQTQWDATPGKSVLSVNPGQLVLGILNVEYEQTLSSDKAYVVGGGYLSALGSDWKGLYGQASYRLYFAATAPSQWFWEIGVSGLKLSADYGTDYAQAGSTLVGPIAGVGYRWVFSEQYAVAVGGGASYYFGNVSVKVGDSESNTPLTGLTPYGLLALGYGW